MGIFIYFVWIRDGNIHLFLLQSVVFYMTDPLQCHSVVAKSQITGMWHCQCSCFVSPIQRVNKRVYDIVLSKKHLFKKNRHNKHMSILYLFQSDHIFTQAYYFFRLTNADRISFVWWERGMVGVSGRKKKTKYSIRHLTMLLKLHRTYVGLKTIDMILVSQR